MQRETEIIHGNIRMAKFLNYVYFPCNETPVGEKYGDGFKIKKKKPGWHLISDHKELPFYRDWNWLMILVEKIESLHNKHHGYFGVHISSNSCTIQGTHLHLSLEDSTYGAVYYDQEYAEDKIKATWEACNNFIKWYNSDEQKNLKFT